VIDVHLGAVDVTVPLAMNECVADNHLPELVSPDVLVR